MFHVFHNRTFYHVYLFIRRSALSLLQQAREQCADLSEISDYILTIKFSYIPDVLKGSIKQLLGENLHYMNKLYKRDDITYETNGGCFRHMCWFWWMGPDGTEAWNRLNCISISLSI